MKEENVVYPILGLVVGSIFGVLLFMYLIKDLNNSNSSSYN